MAAFSRGHEVGFYARRLFPGGADAYAEANGKAGKTVERTQELIAGGQNIIYEAGFVHEGVLAIVDILVRDTNGWKAYEVKSSLRLTRTYHQDAALQYFVLKGAGINIVDFSLVHLNGNYVRRGPVETDKLFVIVSVKDYAEKQLPDIAEKVAKQKLVLNETQAPEVEIGVHCFSPYECDFRGQCWKNIPAGSVYELSGISRQEQERLYRAGYQFPEQVPPEEMLPKLARLQATTRLINAPVIESEKIRAFLGTLTKGIIFLDIENFQPAIPRYEATFPFMALPFAYSIHHRLVDGTIVYHSFLAEPGSDPRKTFLEKFLSDTQGNDSILSYDAGAERAALLMLRKQFPEHSMEIEQRLARLSDLILPFTEGWYHHPKMSGSVSLKNVLPALVPELHYNDLKIQNGSHAMAVYEKMETMTDLFELAVQREALEEYSRLDTLGMVKIFEVLELGAAELPAA